MTPHMTARLRAASIALPLIGAVVLAGCQADQVAVGVVTEVHATGPLQIDRFQLRTGDGRTLTFLIGKLEIDGGSFNAAHLATHAQTGQPVAVAFRVDDQGRNVAYRLADAPWATQ